VQYLLRGRGKGVEGVEGGNKEAWKWLVKDLQANNSFLYQ
jgi:hypothetical protein